ncbi:MAG: hypothetical protein AAGF95_22020 [Chloroflexota bacterium]
MARSTKWSLSLFSSMALVLSLVLTHTSTAQTTTTTPPSLNTFTTAQFVQTTQTRIGEDQTVLYEQGSIVLPDRYQLWRDNPATPTPIDSREIMIGSTLYQLVDDTWEAYEAPEKGIPTAPLLVSHLPQIATQASHTTRIGTQELQGVTTTHYQLSIDHHDLFALFTD